MIKKRLAPNFGGEAWSRDSRSGLGAIVGGHHGPDPGDQEERNPDDEADDAEIQTPGNDGQNQEHDSLANIIDVELSEAGNRKRKQRSQRGLLPLTAGMN